MRTKDFHNGWNPFAGIAFVAVLMIAVPMDLESQTPVQVEDILGLARAEVDEMPRLGGAWVRVERSNEGSLDCEDFPTDARGVPRGGCRFSMEQLKLTERALAWIEFHDELIEGKFYCVPESIPSRWVFGGGAVRIDQQTSRIVQEWQQGETSNFNIFITRTIWMDGRSHPAPSDPDYVSYWGHSIGRYEGDELVVETTNFAFDPNGIDFQGQIPSSWLKRITERYSLIAPDRLRMVFTVEDPLFLSEPFTETLEFVRSDRPFDESLFDAYRNWSECDLENSFAPALNAVPKYRDE